ncbi:MAG: HEAT repeat domain-containing protein, partial [Candidatus Cloacimonetes bacterium]|nr:HEAT repeat domain-containing protein [Candidatus Cloacimonadota bacterium]
MKKYLYLVLMLTVLGAMWADDWAPLSQVEISQLNYMLAQGGLDSLAINFEKDWDLSTKFKTRFQLEMLSQPWTALDKISGLRRLCAPDSTRETLGEIVTRLAEIAFDLENMKLPDSFTSGVARQTYLKKPKDLLFYVEYRLKSIQETYNQAFAALTPEQRDSISAFMFSIWAESEDKEQYESFLSDRHLPSAEDADLLRFAELFEKVDFGSLHRAWEEFYLLCQTCIAQVGNPKYSLKKPLIKSTPFGLMIIGTKGNDLYDRKLIKSYPKQRICFLLDPGGNDRYELPIYTDWRQPFYMLIDAKGNDVYQVPGIAGLFSVSMGLGMSCDLEGNDTYESGDFSFSSLLGYQIHRDKSGFDSYRSGLFTQGSAMFGVSLLQDDQGDDIYSATSFAQGVGGTKAVGALLDRSGHDLYYIGGKYLHKPLMPFDFRSMGQGMGFGFRPDYAGGLGLLVDSIGNDKYIGAVYAQGVGYWYAAGMLIDESGNDVYNAIYYPQGSGIHLACGVLFDAEGDDTFYTRNGPGQGAGHDWGMGILIDKCGSDHYSIPGGNGLGLSNSVGIFVDGSGDDRYERRDQNSLGSANLARSTGGIGLFLDAQGKDSYPDTLFANDKLWQQGTYGIGQDLELNTLSQTKVESLAEEVSAEIDSLAAISEIFAIASEWEVGSAIARVKKARNILFGRAEEATSYIIENKLNTKSGLEYRALDALVQEALVFKNKLFEQLANPDSLAAKNALALIAGTGDSTLVVYVKKLLEDNKYIASALSALGNIRSDESLELLALWLDHSSERIRYIAARSILYHDTEKSRELLKSRWDDSSFLV